MANGLQPGGGNDGVPADCPHCRHAFTVSRSLAGGIANCPHCGKATEVPGLRDPVWRLVQLGAVLGAAAVGAGTGYAHSPVVGIAAGLAVLAAVWLVSRAL